jgi:hypothetical protein
MLIKAAVLQRIMAGEIDTVFRRQVRPTVKAGGTLRTALGVIDIVSVERVTLDDITDDDARRAGMSGRDAAIVAMQAKPDGDDYRVSVRPGGADPRVALRESARLDAVELDELRARLDRLDARSAHGPWTRSVLALIADQPHVRAPDLAASLGRDTPSFKQDVRKLKALGLTISHSPGYELSPRGLAVLALL